MNLSTRWFAASVLVVCLACGGGSDGAETGESASGSGNPSTMSSTVAMPDRNPALAPQGEALFTSKACVGCHTVGKGRLVGPDLQGVTERRSREWVLSMILNPDSMLRADTTARRLLSEYFTPMVNQGLTRDEAAALYEYLLAAGGSSN